VPYRYSLRSLILSALGGLWINIKLRQAIQGRENLCFIGLLKSMYDGMLLSYDVHLRYSNINYIPEKC
jgi:hypothetical protein